MDWQTLNREIAPKLHGNPALADERPIIFIDAERQLLSWLDIDADNNRSFAISTGPDGLSRRSCCSSIPPVS